jgi:acyl carrier protein
MDKAQVLAEVSEIIRDVLDVPNLVVTTSTSAENVEGWDSFNHINIVVAVESHFHVKIHTAEIEELRNVGELVDLIHQKLDARKSG